MGAVPLLIVAGLIEGFLSPAPISPLIKFIVAGLSGIALFLYLKPPRSAGSGGRENLDEEFPARRTPSD